MPNLHEVIAEHASKWKKAGFPVKEFSTIAEILDFAILEDGSPRFLRWPQIRALETYWYLRLVEKNPHVLDLYRKCFLTNTDLLASLGLHSHTVQAFVIDHDIEALWERIRTDDQFSRDNKLEALRETLRLDYPSYIFALAMGAGKTILIGAIIATEFAMALEYPNGPFVQNALVFAPGKTILESLRQLAEVPFERILPPRLHKIFAASVKLTFTRDGEKDLPVIRQHAQHCRHEHREDSHPKANLPPWAERNWTTISPEAKTGRRNCQPSPSGHRFSSSFGGFFRRGPSHLRAGARRGTQKGTEDGGLSSPKQP